jgi:ubiquinone/menaquinone biosynthesis C-methylase UbiE
MNHHDHVNLLRAGVTKNSGKWADLGSGEGAFTLALADLLGKNGEIYSIEKSRDALREQELGMRAQFPNAHVHYLNADFTRPFHVPQLDGIVMANSLHFIRNKESAIRHIQNYLCKDGRLILVEYDTDQGNPWVPHPLSYETWQALAQRCGFEHTQLLHVVPSHFLGQIYSAASW